MWEALGFKESPYDARPLRPLPQDSDLLVGRVDESVDFCTALESASEGVFVLSGPPGVGKTSFFNVQQYRLAAEISDFGPKLLSSDQLCPVHPSDSATTVARRVLDSLVKSVEIECNTTGRKVPNETAKIAKWSRSGASSGFSVGATILGVGGTFGRNVQLPSFGDVTFEGITDAIEVIVSEVVNELGYAGCFATLDNVENLDDDELARLLMTFRDTLFSLSRVWWVVIGQSGLHSLLQTLDPRVADRLGGSIELAPISYDEFEDAIARRVSTFSSKAKNSPLPASIHKKLYDSAFGEVRFVLKSSNDICTKYVATFRKNALKGISLVSDKAKSAIEKFADAMAAHLVNNQIPEEHALNLLRDLVKQDMDGLSLKPKELKVLAKIHDKGETRAKDFRDYPVTSMQDFSSNYLSKFHRAHILSRRQEGRAVFYKLRGTSLLAAELGLLSTNGQDKDARDG